MTAGGTRPVTGQADVAAHAECRKELRRHRHDADPLRAFSEPHDGHLGIVEGRQRLERRRGLLHRNEVGVGGRAVRCPVELAGVHPREPGRSGNARRRAEQQRVHDAVQRRVRAGADRKADQQHRRGELAARQSAQGLPDIVENVHRQSRVRGFAGSVLKPKCGFRLQPEGCASIQVATQLRLSRKPRGPRIRALHPRAGSARVESGAIPGDAAGPAFAIAQPVPALNTQPASPPRRLSIL